jgi:hypothetical protein
MSGQCKVLGTERAAHLERASLSTAIGTGLHRDTKSS